MPESEVHSSLGVGEDTHVICTDGNRYGVKEISEWKFNYCPYCGASVAKTDHGVDPDAQEVFCEQTAQSTWRYCPRCGQEVET